MKKGMRFALPLMIAIAGPAGAHEADTGYWVDSQGQPVVDRYGNCVRTGQWDKDSVAPAGCDGSQGYEALRHISLAAGATFEFDSAALKNEGKAQLDEIARKVVRLGSRVESIHVDGHTDSVGADDYNMDLSLRRARSVTDYLVSRGVDADKIETRGHGETQPIADNSTDTGRQQNRRVEIRVEGDY
ncbi:MAG: OmpA family protein [Pseudomonadota bacterium]|nr:OmpA family protein [Pseudomonadota bacterium]